MKLVWKKKKKKEEEMYGEEGDRKRLRSNPDLPFESSSDEDPRLLQGSGDPSDADAAGWKRLSESLQSQGNKLAEDGRYREALAKWDAALRAEPCNAILLEQKAQVLLEIGDAWGAVKAATRATNLDPSWAEAWITLARAQLNFGEPDVAIASFDKALMIKPDSEEAKADRETAAQLVNKRNQLQSVGSCVGEGRFMVVEEFKGHDHDRDPGTLEA